MCELQPYYIGVEHLGSFSLRDGYMCFVQVYKLTALTAILPIIFN
jgi:hypothetical protein